MNQKHIGVLLIILAVFIASFVLVSKFKEEVIIKEIVQENGSCFLDDGTCLHERNLGLYVFGFGMAGAILLFGFYLTFFDKTQQLIAEHQIKVSKALAAAKKQEREKDEFRAYVAGFNEEEQKILKAVKDQEGIKQSTLRFKTNISKTALSLILKSLEEREIISRKPAGKTKEIYLIKKF